MNEAKRLVAEAEAKYPKTGGEYKRHQVYAKMQKRYPKESRRSIALAIEVALWPW